MKLFYQDHGWAGCIVVVAETEADARRLFAAEKSKSYYCYYEENKEIKSAPIGEVVEFFGDR